jgi:quercetin dioxygenase-like cupin family protein
MNLVASIPESDSLRGLQVLDAQQIEAMPWTPLTGCGGVEQKVLWNLGGFTQALIRYAPGSSTPGEPHLAAHHHVWVTSGDITFAGRHLTAGSYAHVPPGAAHAATDVGPQGCTLLQMHRPHPPREADLLAVQP